MPDGSGVLFLMITSFDQEEGGSPGYNEDESILPLLPSGERELLLRTRRDALEWLRGDTAKWQERKMKEDRRNKALQPGPDFGSEENEEALYRPVVRRFRGGHFLALGTEGLRMLREGPHHVLFLCGLYGLVTPTEPVQWHNCPVEPKLGICDVWGRSQAITEALLAFAREHKIQRVFDVTAVTWRRSLVDWNRLHRALPNNVLHCFDVDGAEDFALIAFSELMRDILLPAPEETLLGYRADGGLENRGRLIRFSESTEPPPKSARADLRPRRDPTDEIDRFRRGLVRLLKRLGGEGENEHASMPTLVRRATPYIGNSEVERAMRGVGRMRNTAVYERPLEQPELTEFVGHAKLIAEWAMSSPCDVPEFDTDWDRILRDAQTR